LRTAADRIDSSGHNSGNTSDGVTKEHGQLADIGNGPEKAKDRKGLTNASVFGGIGVSSTAILKECESSRIGNTNLKHPESLAKAAAALGSNKLIRTEDTDSTRTLGPRALDYFDGKS
jgi:hypothetical protein